MTRHPPLPPPDVATSTDWWLSLLSGTVAAVITALTVYGVFLLTRKSERNKAQADRTAESVARVVNAAGAFTMKASDFEEHKASTFDALKTFQLALVEFAAREISDHPMVARWATRQASDMAAEATPIMFADDKLVWESACLDHDPAHLATQISAALMRWLRDGTHRKFNSALPSDIWNF